jgi:hypothetical protein
MARTYGGTGNTDARPPAVRLIILLTPSPCPRRGLGRGPMAALYPPEVAAVQRNFRLTSPAARHARGDLS